MNKYFYTELRMVEGFAYILEKDELTRLVPIDPEFVVIRIRERNGIDIPDVYLNVIKALEIAKSLDKKTYKQLKKYLMNMGILQEED